MFTQLPALRRRSASHCSWSYFGKAFRSLPLLGLAALTAPSLAANASSTNVPPGLRAALYQALAKDAGPSFSIAKDGCVAIPAQQLTGCFDQPAVHFHRRDGQQLSLALSAYGRQGHLRSATSVRPTFSGNEVTYHAGDLTQWWRVLPAGFEQGFTVTRRPPGSTPLLISLTASLTPRSSSDSLLAWGAFRYGDLVVTDARGRVVHATLAANGRHLQIAVKDTRAVYPLTIDPLVWIEQKVTAGDGTTHDLFGQSVAMDGDIALVGSPNTFFSGGSTGPGAVYVYTLSSGTWTFVQELTASDGSTGDRFGTSVALRGNAAVVGAPDAASSSGALQGAAYVFTKNADGSWSQQQKLTALDGASGDLFGASVALDGTSVLVGAPHAMDGGQTWLGAAYVFTQSGSMWSQVQKLINSDTDVYDFGSAVAVDGTNALVGADCGYDPYLDECGYSVGYAFAETNGTWNPVALPYGSGSAVALSGDTAVTTNEPYFSDPDYGFSQGTAVIYAVSGGTWTPVAAFYGNTSGGYFSDDYGDAAAVSSNTVLVGADYFGYLSGSAFEYTDSGGTWAQTQTFAGSDNNAQGDYFGSGVALSGGLALIGAEGATVTGHPYQGAAYFYAQSNLGLTVSAPGSAPQDQDYVSQTIATNDASATTPAAVSVTVAVPAAASFVSASASQGTCSEGSGVVACDFGQIAGNGGTAIANVTLKATGNVGDVINNTASVTNAIPSLTASAPTAIAPIPTVTLDLSGAANGDLGNGVSIKYSFTVSNDSTDGTTATGIMVTDPLPANATLIQVSSSQGSCSGDDSQVSCSLGALDAGHATSINLHITVPHGPCTISDTATGTADQPLNPNSNPSVTVTVNRSNC